MDGRGQVKERYGEEGLEGEEGGKTANVKKIIIKIIKKFFTKKMPVKCSETLKSAS